MEILAFRTGPVFLTVSEEKIGGSPLSDIQLLSWDMGWEKIQVSGAQR